MTDTEQAARESSKANILLVDDNPAGLLTLEAIPGDFGHNLVKAGSGKEALRQVMAHDFAVILLDVQMPDMDVGFAERPRRARPGPGYVTRLDEFMLAEVDVSFPDGDEQRLEDAESRGVVSRQEGVGASRR